MMPPPARPPSLWHRFRRLFWYRNVKQTPTILQMEAVECGAAALAMVLAHHGAWIPLEQLRVSCGVSRDGSKASNIVRAARTFGLDAKGFRKEPSTLHELPMPCIIHWNFNHFVVLEGIDGGDVYHQRSRDRPPANRHGRTRSRLHRRRTGDGADRRVQAVRQQAAGLAAVAARTALVENPPSGYWSSSASRWWCRRSSPPDFQRSSSTTS